MSDYGYQGGYGNRGGYGNYQGHGNRGGYRGHGGRGGQGGYSNYDRNAVTHSNRNDYDQGQENNTNYGHRGNRGTSGYHGNSGNRETSGYHGNYGYREDGGYNSNRGDRGNSGYQTNDTYHGNDGSRGKYRAQGNRGGGYQGPTHFYARKESYNRDDRDEYPEADEASAYNSTEYGPYQVLNLKIYPYVSSQTLKKISDLLFKCRKMSQVRLTVYDYNDQLRHDLRNLRETIERDEEVECWSSDESIYEDKNENEDEDEDYDDISSGYKLEVKLPGARLSDLIVMRKYMEPKIKQHLQEFKATAKSSVNPIGFVLRGEKKEDLEECKKKLLILYNNFTVLPLFKGYQQDRITTLYSALKNVLSNLGSDIKAAKIFSARPEDYYREYEKLVGEIPELKKGYEKKTKKSKLRFVLIGRDFRDRDIGDEKRRLFENLINKKCNLFRNSIHVIQQEPITNQETTKIIQIAIAHKFYVQIKPKDNSDGVSGSNLGFEIVLQTYYTDSTSKSYFEEGFKEAETKIKDLLRPPRETYKFESEFDSLCFKKLILPDIRDDLKAANVTFAVNFNNKSEATEATFEGKMHAIKLYKGTFEKRIKEIKHILLEDLIDSADEAQMRFRFDDANISTIRQKNEIFFKELTNFMQEKFPDTVLKFDVTLKLEEVPGQAKVQSTSQPQKQSEAKAPIINLKIGSLNEKSLENATVWIQDYFKNFKSALIEASLAELIKDSGSNSSEAFLKSYLVFAFQKNQSSLSIAGNDQEVKKVMELAKQIKDKKKIISIKVPYRYAFLKDSLSNAKELISPGVNCLILPDAIQINGEESKVQTLKVAMEKLIEEKVSQITKYVIPDIPDSYTNLLESKENSVQKLADNHKVKFYLKKSAHSEIEVKIALQNQDKSKTLILINDDITSLHADAVVNSTDLRFGGDIIVQGIAKALYEKAGPKYAEECKNSKPLNEGEVLTTGSGKMTNYSSIINCCPPIYKDDNTLDKTIETLKICITNVIKEANSKKMKSIVIPFIGLGNFGNVIQEGLSTIIETLANSLFNSETTLEKIILVEKSDDMVELAKKKICSLIEEIKEYVPAYQFFYADKTWEKYDIEANRKLNQALERKEKSCLIQLSISRTIGSHEFDIANKKIIKKSLGTVSTLERKADGWYQGSTKFQDNVSEIIDNYASKGLKQFELFIDEYVVDLENMKQTNVQTKFDRSVKKVPFADGGSKVQDKSLKLKNVTKTENFTFSIGKKKGSILIKGFKETNFKAIQQEFEDIFNKEMIEKLIEIPLHIDEISKAYLDEEISSNNVSILEQTESKMKLRGLSTVIIKIEQFLKEYEKKKALPTTWTKMNQNFELIELQTSDSEYQNVVKLYSQTMDARRIKKIHRIQNEKFWKDFQKEKEDLIARRLRAGLSKEVTTMELWHGTRGAHPSALYAGDEECFDMQYANDGLWGRGLYFAVNAQYSDDFAHPVGGVNKLFMLTEVIVGHTIKLPMDKTLRKPPERSDLKEKICYDSIQGETNGSVIYILYRMRRAYPKYLVEYK